MKKITLAFLILITLFLNTSIANSQKITTISKDSNSKVNTSTYSDRNRIKDNTQYIKEINIKISNINEIQNTYITTLGFKIPENPNTTVPVSDLNGMDITSLDTTVPLSSLNSSDLRYMTDSVHISALEGKDLSSIERKIGSDGMVQIKDLGGIDLSGLTEGIPLSQLSGKVDLTNMLDHISTPDLSSIQNGSFKIMTIPSFCPYPGGCQCVAPSASTTASGIIKSNFTSNMNQLEQGIIEKIGRQDASLDIKSCSPRAINTVIKAIECQRIRVEVAFNVLSEREEKMLNKQRVILEKMAEDKIKAAQRMEIGSDKLKMACEAASVQTGLNNVTARTTENYKTISNTITSYSDLNKNTLKTLSGVVGQKYYETTSGAAISRVDASLVSQIPTDLVDNQDTEIEFVHFDEEGEIVGIPKTTEGLLIPSSYRFDDVYPGANRNYSGIVLDRPIIKSPEHLFVAVDSGINLINPLPDETNISSMLNREGNNKKYINSLSKKARYSLAQDIINFSTAFRSIEIPDNDGISPTEPQITQGAQYIKNSLAKLGTSESEYQGIGNDISEYQFLDALVRIRPQAPGYVALTSIDNPSNINKEVIRGMATTLAIKWKQYQILEKILATRAATLAVNLDK